MTVVEGCAKVKSACATKGQTHRFMGLGIAIPDQNPVLEGGA